MDQEGFRIPSFPHGNCTRIAGAHGRQCVCSRCLLLASELCSELPSKQQPILRVAIPRSWQASARDRLLRSQHCVLEIRALCGKTTTTTVTLIRQGLQFTTSFYRLACLLRYWRALWAPVLTRLLDLECSLSLFECCFSLDVDLTINPHARSSSHLDSSDAQDFQLHRPSSPWLGQDDACNGFWPSAPPGHVHAAHQHQAEHGHTAPDAAESTGPGPSCQPLIQHPLCFEPQWPRPRLGHLRQSWSLRALDASSAEQSRFSAAEPRAPCPRPQCRQPAILVQGHY